MLAPFLQCYFQSEFYPVDLIRASHQCVMQLTNENRWKEVFACTKDVNIFRYFAQDAQFSQVLRPIFVQTPRIFLNGFFSDLAAIDLKKALCRENVSFLGTK